MSQVPENVRAALERMCTPLHKSRMDGVTAAEDARCMGIIKAHIEQQAMAAPSDLRAAAVKVSVAVDLLGEPQGWLDGLENLLAANADLDRALALPGPAAQDRRDAGLWKELAETYYGKMQYPDTPELATGALDALFDKMKRERAK